MVVLMVVPMVDPLDVLMDAKKVAPTVDWRVQENKNEKYRYY